MRNEHNRSEFGLDGNRTLQCVGMLLLAKTLLSLKSILVSLSLFFFTFLETWQKCRLRCKALAEVPSNYIMGLHDIIEGFGYTFRPLISIVYTSNSISFWNAKSKTVLYSRYMHYFGLLLLNTLELNMSVTFKLLRRHKASHVTSTGVVRKNLCLPRWPVWLGLCIQFSSCECKTASSLVKAARKLPSETVRQYSRLFVPFPFEITCTSVLKNSHCQAQKTKVHFPT